MGGGGRRIRDHLRRHGYPEPYELLKELTRGKEKIGQKDIAEFIEALNVKEAVKAQLRALTPSTYLGVDLLS